MEKLDIIIRIFELLGAAIIGGWMSRILTVKARVRTENAGADKAETEVRADQIENIEKLVEKVYKPTIETLTAQVQSLQTRVDELEQENIQLRAALREVSPESVPSRRGHNGKNAPRSGDGRFVKVASDGE